jgi:cellulase/cellobiase CelA1
VIDQWPGGFKGDVTIFNSGPAINGWTLTWTFPTTGQTIYQLWNGNFVQSGTNVSVTNLSYNNVIATGGNVNFGFLSNWSGTNPVPTAFRLNGANCTLR